MYVETRNPDSDGSELTETSSFDGRGVRDLVSTLVGFILDCDVRRFESLSEGRKGRQGIARETTCGTIEFCCPMQSGCMNGQVAGCYESVDAHSTAHYVVTDFVDEGVRCLGSCELHVRVANRSQCRIEEKLVIEKIRATSVERCNDLLVSVWSSIHFLYSKSPANCSDFLQCMVE